jgi:hypothetical protein
MSDPLHQTTSLSYLEMFSTNKRQPPLRFPAAACFRRKESQSFAITRAAIVKVQATGK